MIMTKAVFQLNMKEAIDKLDYLLSVDFSLDLSDEARGVIEAVRNDLDALLSLEDICEVMEAQDKGN